MIEVEIRGRLTKEKFLELKDFFDKNAEHVESHDREMYLLKGYPGYDHFVARDTDIRLRNTDGQCEIMLKRKVNDDYQSRKEISLALKDNTLDNAKEIVKALGYTKGLRMNRKKHIYRYHDVEWSLVDPGKDLYYFEAEKEATTDAEAASLQDVLMKEAEHLHLAVFTQEETQDFIQLLDREVNVEVSF